MTRSDIGWKCVGHIPPLAHCGRWKYNWFTWLESTVTSGWLISSEPGVRVSVMHLVQVSHTNCIHLSSVIITSMCKLFGQWFKEANQYTFFCGSNTIAYLLLWSSVSTIYEPQKHPFSWNLFAPQTSHQMDFEKSPSNITGRNEKKITR